MKSLETLVDPLAWLNDLSATGSDQISRAEGVVEGEAPGLAAGLGGADPAWAFAGADHAEATLEATGQVCKTGCPIRERCVEEACRIYRLEQAAEDFLAEPTQADWLMDNL